MFVPGPHWNPVQPFNSQPVSQPFHPSPKVVNNKVESPPAKPVTSPVLPQSKPTDSVTISSAAQAKATTAASTASTTTSGPSALDQKVATGQQQNLHSLTADRRDVRQDIENENDDDEGNDGDDPINGMEEHDRDGSEDAQTLPQRVSLGASPHDTSNSFQGLAVGQKDDGQGISPNSSNASKIEPTLHQNPPSDPQVEKILLDLKGLLADLAKA